MANTLRAASMTSCFDTSHGMATWQPTSSPPIPAIAMLLLASCGAVKGNEGDASIDPPGFDAPVDGPPQSRSCEGLGPICGPSMNDNCCQAATVPGGMFFRGWDEALDAYNDMGYPATIGDFVLDTYEVTVGRFRAFIGAGMGTQAGPPPAGAGAHPRLPGSGWDGSWNGNLRTDAASLKSAIKCNPQFQTWTDTPGTNENKPMGCVTWYEAMAFCIWDGGYLPTEAEWNYAAAGGRDQRAHPWSLPASATTLDCTYANYRINNPTGMFCVNGTEGGLLHVGSLSPKGNGRWGHSDLAGSMWEWTLDWSATPYQLPCDDCANLTNSSSRVMRGGSFADTMVYLRTAARYSRLPSDRSSAVGVRCARTR